jgi:short-subunit dehydrogenase/SAM-dependent methyltransferase
MIHRIFNTRRKKLYLLGLAASIGALGIATLKLRRTRRAERWRKHREGQIQHHTALVTGASSGIGQAYARWLASLGYNLLLVARRAQRLNNLVEECRLHFGVHAEVMIADLSTAEGIERVEQRIENGEDISFLVNNAIEGHLGMINCHALASVRFCRAALPGMLARNDGAIVNVSSIGAFIPKPKDVTYCASKAYLNSFSESLAMELAHTGVRVQSLAPGFTLTEFHDHPQYAEFEIKKRIPRWLWMTPDEVVRASLQALGENRVVCIPGFKNQVIAAAGRIGLTNTLMDILGGFFKQTPLRPMKASTLSLLACPTCHGSLALDGSLSSGKLTCQRCHKEYPITGAIPRFVRLETLGGMNRSFAGLYEWFSIFYQLFSKVAFAYIGMSEGAARREVLDRLEPRGGRILEVSVGPGSNLPYLVGAPGVGEVIGLDISAGQLARCQSYTRKQGWEVDLFQGSAEELPFKDNSFESVFHIGGINFFNDKKKAIAEMIRVAQPGARIVICDETERGAQAYERVIPGFKKTFDKPRQVVKAPVDLVPGEMEEIRVSAVWKDWMYCLEFRKPGIL